MAFTQYPAASSSGKTSYRTTLTSGTSWTVPAGVTYVNVTCVGGGGGGGGASVINTSSGGGGTGGTTTFSTISASGGVGGRNAHANLSGRNWGGGGSSAQANSGWGGDPGWSMTTGFSTAIWLVGWMGGHGQVVSGNLTVTPAASISYSIGAGGSGGSAGAGDAGGAGGSGRIDIEYWVQECLWKNYLQ